jgi:cell wall-associated NlpC family hydrolase
MRILATARSPALRGAVVALVLAAAAGAAGAAPDDAGDPLLKLLADKGLLADGPARADAAAAERSVKPVKLLQQVQDRASQLTAAALNLVGVHYRHGGASVDTGFDCSGFTRHVVEMSLGLVLPRRADDQASAPGLVNVRREDLRPGDLVFFNTLKRTFSHVGIYIGDNRFIHSPRSGANVRTEDMNFAYWATRFTGARRIETTAAVEPRRDASEPIPASGGS